jgi:hypothetical protein
MIIYGKDGFPVEYIAGRNIQRIIRYLIHGSIIETLKRAK